jgi:O-antigen/teichoic acid export membrane protein
MLATVSPRSILQVVLSAAFGRLATALSQIVAAVYLSPTDFGVYAAAVGITTVTTALRAGGTGNHVQTMTPAEFECDAGRFFRYSIVFTAFGAVLTMALAWPIAHWFASSNAYPLRDLITTTLVIGGSFVVFNLNVFPRARMIAFLRLGEISLLDTITGAIKLFGTWVLARAGYGPMALAGSILIAQTVESCWTWLRSGLRPSSLRPQGPWFRATFIEMRLPLVVGLMVTLNSQTDSLVGSAFLPAAVLGYYYFASQLAVQPASLVGNTLRSVFTATTAQVRGDENKEHASLRTIFNGAMVFMPLVTMLIPTVFDSFERTIWGGKWADAYYPVLILSATLVYPAALQLVSAPIAGVRDWKLAIRLDLLRGVSKIVPAFAASIFIVLLNLNALTSAIVLSAAVGAVSAVVASRELYRIIVRSGMSRQTVLYELYSTPLAALLSALAAAGLAHSAVDPLRMHLSLRLTSAIECVLAGSLYLFCALILLRFGYTETLSRLIRALPDFMQPLAKRVFVI